MVSSPGERSSPSAHCQVSSEWVLRHPHSHKGVLWLLGPWWRERFPKAEKTRKGEGAEQLSIAWERGPWASASGSA